MRVSAKKALLAVLLAVLMVAFSLPALAAPTADPNYVEITLAEFKEQYPGYQGIDDPRDAPATRVADPGYVVNSYSGPFVWKQVGSKWYLYASNGTVKVTSGGWYQDGGYWYFLYPVGALKNDETVASGEMAVGWELIGGHWYYFSGSGVMQKDWYQISNVWYYFRTASETISGKSYPTGSMVVGAHYLNSTKGSTVKDRNYYFDAYGAMQDWYYPLDTSNKSNVYVTQAFKEGGHNGLDISSYYGAPIKSAIGGQVVYCANQASMGRCVIERTSVMDANGKPLSVRYMHMSSLNVTGTTAGTSSSIYTTKGQNIGAVGNSGFVIPAPTTSNPYAGTHLHIDVNPYDLWNASVTYDQQYNPAAFFTSVTFSGSTAYGSTLN